MKMQGVITGKRVYNVGYRVFLLQRSLELGFQKFNVRNRIQNGADQVVVQYEGEPGQVDALSSIIREECLPDAVVSDVAFESYEGYVVSVADYMHVIQIEQLSKGIPAIISIDRKQDSLLEKNDQILQKMDRMETSITSEIHDLRTDLRSHLDQKLSAMEQDIQQIKAKIGLL
ncbi:MULTISPECIES: acylphosphatase [unclassified Methanoculleus]|mgnify:CR=1 FL=1|uniref:acylphosphatase n=1 Tax=unclassified Methanoculleus TaxID=2619537 RepID=UPI0026001A66|nr:MULTISPECIES: acylphosphatase [unclassified Methanoculleus]MCK9318328.1 acylphosphatase [Methanoculleus sp.]MDD2253866.1 acylphosphatase [Methanoculleus sp.]MDD2786550.1 acylphosphatase [Methanoculleus sp.]MDD3215601.1 acylphosphatase [Methanoculleus sp.]MDD4313479.1 acylphosphatase [Methanoculleus sp.]